LAPHYAARLTDSVSKLNYDVKDLSGVDGDPALVDSCHAVIRGATLVIAFAENMTVSAAYFLGIARAAATPTIIMQFTSGERLLPGFPPEHGPRTLPPHDSELGGEILRAEIEIFEDEAIELDRQDEIGRYVDFLQTSSTPGSYDSLHRAVFINNFRDTYNVANAGVVGNEATFSEGQSKK
jgi:hypothetical protein